MQNSINPIALLTACGLIACNAGAQTLFNYSGADRMEKIVAAAKKEGTLTMYTTFAEKDQPTLIRPFEATKCCSERSPRRRRRSTAWT